MEYYQSIQNRTGQTVAVINTHTPGLKVGGKTAADLLALSLGLDGLAQSRDNLNFAEDEATRAEMAAFLQIRILALRVPSLIENQLGNDDPLTDGLDPVYGIVPRTTERAIKRARALLPVWTKANTVLAAQVPAQPPVTRNGKTVADLTTLVDDHPALEQAVENTASEALDGRTDLRLAARSLDKLNKRAYAILKGLADPDSVLEAALAQIDTESEGRPETLSIDKVLQGGLDGLHVLVNYDSGSGDGATESFLQWMVTGLDLDFTHEVAVDPSGNTLGPFSVGQTVKIRTHVSNSHGSRTSSVRTIIIQPPVV